MIAVVSSTIFPPTTLAHGAERSWLRPTERRTQTRATVESLVALGLSDIYVADNSGAAWDRAAGEDLCPAHVRIFHHHQYQNKGISELYLLLAALEDLPRGVPILKLSGRYTLTRDLSPEIQGAEFVARVYRSRWGMRSISTRAYIARDRDVLERFLRRTLHEVFGYAARIVGVRSAARIVTNSLAPARDHYPYDDPPAAIEGPSARALKQLGLVVRTVAPLGVHGWVGGAQRAFVDE